MFARSVYQSILVDPADTCGVRAQSGFGGGGKPTLHLTQVLQHPRTGPIEVGAVLKQDVHVAIPEEGVATDCLRAGRSEEHTSALQSLMRISYAVFCSTTHTHIFFISL